MTSKTDSRVALGREMATLGAAPNSDINDGRKMRSVRSRRKIVAALFELIRGGNVLPSSSEIAEASGVSMRTVFRHIQDMDTLYEEMALQIETEINPVLSAPFQATQWRDRLTELIRRRSSVYEHVMLLKVSAGLRRHRSEFLMADYQKFLDCEREGLDAILPDEIARDPTIVSGLLLTTSFQAWARLRLDRGLSPAQSEETVRRLADALLDVH